jgi:hypothetical protein
MYRPGMCFRMLCRFCRYVVGTRERPGSRVPNTHLQNLHNTSITLRYGAIITVPKTS